MGLFAKFKEAWLKPMSFDSLNEGFYDDLEEALILADSIAVMSEGELLQLGSAEGVFRRPANNYIASFLGLNDIVWKDDGSVLKVIRHGEKG